MPRKKEHKRTHKKHYVNYKAKRYAPSANSLTNGMPETTIMNCRYCEPLALTSTSGSLATANYTCNGPYDPRVAAGGGTASGYYQYMNNYYSNAFVISSRIKCKYMMDSTSTSIPIACGVYPYDASVSLTGQSYTSWPAFREAGNFVGTLSTNKPEVNLTAYFSHKKNIGTDLLNITDNGNTRGGNAAVLWYYEVFSQPVDIASTPSVVTVMVQIDYEVMFTERLPLVPH